MSLLRRVTDASAPASVLVIRLLVGLVFVPEGLKKFLFPEQWGAGRFLRIGIPAAQAMAILPFRADVQHRHLSLTP